MDLKINIELSLSKETIELVENVLSKAYCGCGSCVTTIEDKKDPEPSPEPAPAKPARQRTRKAAPAADTPAAENKEQETADQPADTTSAAENKEQEMPDQPADATSATEAPAAKDPQPEETQIQEDIKVEDVRKAVSAKINNHKDKIVDKLRSLGATNVSTLKPAKYKEFIDYCNSLK